MLEKQSSEVVVTRPRVVARVRQGRELLLCVMRDSSNIDYFSGFCRSSGELSFGGGACSMRRLEARVPSIVGCCHAWWSLDAHSCQNSKNMWSSQTAPIVGSQIISSNLFLGLEAPMGFGMVGEEEREIDTRFTVVRPIVPTST